MNKNVIIVGAGGHAKVVADVIRKNGDIVVGFLDDDRCKHGKDFFGAKILGFVSEYDVFRSDACFIIAIGDNAVRKTLSSKMVCNWYTAVHPDAVVSEGVIIGNGSFVGAGAVLNPDTKIGNHVIINTCAVVEHDCRVGDFTHISPNSAVCGGCKIGVQVWIGAGSTVINGLNICDEVIIGAGATVVDDVKQKGKYIGVPAHRI